MCVRAPSVPFHLILQQKQIEFTAAILVVATTINQFTVAACLPGTVIYLHLSVLH